MAVPASATAAAPVAIPASSSHHMQQGYSRSDVPGAAIAAWGSSYDENQSMLACGSSGNSRSRAARAAALATMMTGGEAQPKFWGPGQLPTMPQNMRSSCGSFSGGGMNACLQDQQQQQQQQQVVQHNHSAPSPGTSISACQGSQQLQLVQQAAIAAGGRVFGGGTMLEQAEALANDQQPEMLLHEVDAQLLQLRKQLESNAGQPPFEGAAAGAANAPLGQVTAFSAAAMPPGAGVMLSGSGGCFDAYNDVAGMACMPPNHAMQIQGISAAADHAGLQLPASQSAPGGGLLQLQMAAAINDSASQLAALGLDAAGQPLQQHHLQNSDPCLAMYREMMPVSGYDDQQYVGSGSMLVGQAPVVQARVCEVKEKMRQLADVQTVRD
jgi:hypothetical protein